MSVSVIMTCHNERPFIADAIRSVVAQTAYDQVLEILVVDDASTDGSREALHALAETNDKLRIIEADGVGAPAARNLTIARARGRYLAILDGDDLWPPAKLGRQLAAARRSRPDTVLWYSDYVDFSGDPASGKRCPVRVFGEESADVLADFFLHDGPIIPSTVLVRAEPVRAVGGLDPSLRSDEETDLWLKLAAAGYRFRYVPDAIALKRRHASNMTGDPAPWDGFQEVISEIWVKRVPALARLRARRAAYRRAKIASAFLKRNDKAEAWRYLRRSILGYPLYPRAYAVALLAAVPTGMRGRLRALLERARDGGRRVFAAARAAR